MTEMRRNNQIKESERHVHALLKALDILDCFEFQDSLSLKQICELTGLNKSRIIRLCGTLQAKRFLIQQPETGGYTLGPRLLSLGKAYERRNTLISISRPILRDLAQKTGESASLYVIDGHLRLCLAREEGTYLVRFLISEGEHLPLYAGAGSKVLLAFGPENLRREVLKRSNRKKLTPTTLTHAEDFRKEFETIRRQGYSFSAGERDPDAGALAAPVYDHEKNICAALAIAGPINRFQPENRGRYLPSLLDAARQLSEALGYK